MKLTACGVPAGMLAVYIPCWLFLNGESACVHGAQVARLDYGRDIQPILSENCFHCHGPDATKRKAGLRLDSYAGATMVRAGRAAIRPGDSNHSEIISRIFSDDPNER